MNQYDASHICNVPLRAYKRLENDDKLSSKGYGDKCLLKDTLTLANQFKGETISSLDRSNNRKTKMINTIY